MSEESNAAPPGNVDVLDAFISSAEMADLLQRQSAVALGGGGEGGAAIRTLYHEITFSISALERRVPDAARVAADPFLFRYLVGRLDRRMLALLSREAGRGGPLDVVRAGGAMLNINLTVPAILSEDFNRLVAAAGAQASRIGVEVSLVEVMSDHAAFERARSRLADCRARLVLDGVSHLALQLVRPAMLQAAMIKLEWSGRLAELSESDADVIEAALREIGVERVILQRAETETALRWGLAHGIRRFQGRHVDAMLGAARLVGCSHAAACGLRQCIDRAAAATPLGRLGCRDLDLLDAGAPARTDLLTGLMPAAAPEGVVR